MKYRNLILSVVCALTLQGCVTNPIKNISSLIPGSFNDDQPYLTQLEAQKKEGMKSVGADTDRLLRQSEGSGLIDYQALESEINKHFSRLQSSSGIEGLTGRAYLSAERGFNARATADGNVYIPIEMLNDLVSEHELAALLSHELAHSILNHTDSDMLISLQKKAMMVMNFATSLDKGKQTSTSIMDSRRIQNSMAMLMLSDGFLNPSWSRGQEQVADKLGLDILVRAGYNPEAMNVLLNKIAVWELKNKALIEEQEIYRQAVLEEARKNAGADLNQQLSLALSDAGGQLKEMLTSFSDSHPEAQERIDTLRTYSQLHYRRAARPPMKDTRWRKQVKNRKTQALIAAVIKVKEAQGLLSQNEIDEASRVAISAVNNYTSQQNFLRVTLLNIRDAQGKGNAVRANATQGLKGKYPAFILKYSYTIRGINNKDELKKRSDQLMIAFEDYGKPPQYYSKMIALAQATDNKLLKSRLQLECRLSYAGEAVACDVNEDTASQEISYNRLINQLL